MSFKGKRRNLILNIVYETAFESAMCKVILFRTKSAKLKLKYIGSVTLQSAQNKILLRDILLLSTKKKNINKSTEREYYQTSEINSFHARLNNTIYL